MTAEMTAPPKLPTAMIRYWRQSSSGSIGSGVAVSFRPSAISVARQIVLTKARVIGDRLPPCTSTTVNAVIDSISSNDPR